MAERIGQTNGLKIGNILSINSFITEIPLNSTDRTLPKLHPFDVRVCKRGRSRRFIAIPIPITYHF